MYSVYRPLYFLEIKLSGNVIRIGSPNFDDKYLKSNGDIGTTLTTKINFLCN